MRFMASGPRDRSALAALEKLVIPEVHDDGQRALREWTFEDLAGATGLSRGKVHGLLKRPDEKDLWGELAPVLKKLDTTGRERRHDGPGGREPHYFRVEAELGWALGVDFDHDRVFLRAANLAGAINWRKDISPREFEADPDEDAPFVDRHPAEAIEKVAKALKPLISERGGFDGLVGIGVALPAPVLEDGHRRYAASAVLAAWAEVNVEDELREALEAPDEVPILVGNDANLGARAEHAYGAARGQGTMVYVKTVFGKAGIGAGMLQDHRSYRGHQGLAGEIGHVIVRPVPGAAAEAEDRCHHCGQRDCLQQLTSADHVLRQLGDADLRLLWPDRKPSQLDWSDIVAALDRDDLATSEAKAHAKLRAEVDFACRHLGRALATVVTLNNPPLLVVGGALIRARDRLMALGHDDPIDGEIDERTMSDATYELRAGEIEHAVVEGAIAAVLDRDGPTYLLSYCRQWELEHAERNAQAA